MALIPLLFAYSFGTILIVNCEYDPSEGNAYRSKILEKERRDSDHVISYHLKLAPWEKQDHITKVKVDKNKFHRLYKREEVVIQVKDGLIGMEWFVVE